MSKSALQAVKTCDGNAISELQADPVETKILNDSNTNISSSAFTPLNAILDVFGVLFSKSP